MSDGGLRLGLYGRSDKNGTNSENTKLIGFDNAKREVKLTPIFFRPSNWKKRVDIHSDEEDSRKNKYLLECLDVIFRHIKF